MKYLKLIILFLSLTVYSQSGRVVKIKEEKAIKLVDTDEILMYELQE